MPVNPTLTSTRLRELLDYDPETGVFTWIKKPRRSTRVGSRAGSLGAFDGYRLIRIDHELYRGHRLAWFWVHGVWPSSQIDHINGIRDDNRIANLREADNAQNKQNQVRARSDSRSGYLGVTTHKPGVFRAKIQIAGKVHYLGLFDTPEAAHAAYLEAKRRLHPFWSGHHEAVTSSQ